jgi:hypothetical protein
MCVGPADCPSMIETLGGVSHYGKGGFRDRFTGIGAQSWRPTGDALLGLNLAADDGTLRIIEMAEIRSLLLRIDDADSEVQSTLVFDFGITRG